MSTIAATIDFARIQENWEIVVVGAGPAGALAARELARRGKQVLLVDKAAFPRYKVCGCCLSDTAVSILHQCQLQDILPALNAVPLKELRLFARNNSASIALSSGFALSRQSLDSALVGAAIEAGVHFSPQTSAYLGDIAFDKRSVQLMQDQESAQILASQVILADGLNGSALKKLKLLPIQPASNSRIGAGVIVREFDQDFYTDGTIYMSCDQGGYVGLVRLENGLLDIAAAFDPEFVKQHGGAGRAAERIMSASSLPNIPDLADLDWHGTPILTRHRQAAADRIFVIGDSAAYGEPFTGEGMGWAMASARAVVPFVISALSSGENFDCRLWPKEHTRQIANRQRTSKMLGQFLRQPQMVELSTKAINLLPSMAESLARHITKSAVSEVFLSNTL